jgi:hypothetical protein
MPSEVAVFPLNADDSLGLSDAVPPSQTSLARERFWTDWQLVKMKKSKAQSIENFLINRHKN